jgi:hypothetical protein
LEHQTNKGVGLFAKTSVDEKIHFVTQLNQIFEFLNDRKMKIVVAKIILFITLFGVILMFSSKKGRHLWNRLITSSPKTLSQTILIMAGT